LLKKEYYNIIPLILGSVSLNLPNWSSEALYDDKIIYKYLGLVIYKGGIPYRDAFDNKPPLIFFLNALTWFTGPRVIWIADTLLVLLATLLFYNLCKKNKLAWPWFLPLLFNLIIRNNLISYGIGMTREYTAVFLLLFFCVIFYKNAYKYIILGALIALTFWMQQDATITLLPLVIYALLIQETPSIAVLRRILYALIGFVVITFPVTLYFAYNHSLSFLWSDTFLFNINLPRQPVPWFTEMKLIKHALHDSEMEMAFYTALILGASGLLLTRKKGSLLLYAFLTLLLSFIAEYLTGRMHDGPGYMHYLLPLSASIPILVYVIFTESEISFLKDKYAQFIIPAILSVVLILGTLRYATVALSPESKKISETELPEIDFLDKQKLTDYQLYVFDDTYLIYLFNKYKILSPSRWNYHFFGPSHFDWDKDPALLHGIQQDLKKHKTTWILDCSGFWNYPNSKLFLPEWKRFLQEHYTRLITDSSNRSLWRIQ